MDINSRLIMMGAGGLATSGGYWFSILSNGSIGLTARGLGIDSSGNLYAGIQINESGAPRPSVAKLSSDGTLLQTTKYDGGYSSQYIANLAVSSTGETYIGGGISPDDGFLLRVSSTGSVVASRGQSGSSTLSPDEIALAPDGSYYMIGYTFNGGGGSVDALVVKYDSSNNVAWKRYAGFSSSEQFYGGAVDSSNRIFCGGYTSSGSVYTSIGVLFNSNGTVAYTRGLTGSSLVCYGKPFVDGNDNVYSWFRDFTSNTVGIFKINSAGNLLWQKTIVNGTSNGRSGAVDSQGNAYFSTGTRTLYKVDSNGNLLWARDLEATASGYSSSIHSVVVDALDNVYACATTRDGSNALNDVIVIKPDPSGAGTGSYGDFSWVANTSVSLATSSYTWGNISLGSGGLSLTDLTPSFTASSATLTNTVLTL